jgi:siroheme synthase
VNYGKVYLIGAGPGECGLIMVRAVELIKTATIGPVTTEQLTRLNVKVNSQARSHTIDGLTDTLI